MSNTACADVPCPECDGTGEFEHPHSRPELEMIWPCTTCGGTGLIGPESIFYEFAQKQTEKVSGQ